MLHYISLLHFRVKKGDFDELLQLDNSEKTNQENKTTADKHLTVENGVVIPSNDKSRSASINSLSTDLSFEEEMKLAIEMSKAEMRKVNNLLGSTSNLSQEQPGHLNKSVTKTGHGESSEVSKEIGNDCVVVIDDNDDDVETDNVFTIDDNDVETDNVFTVDDDDDCDAELALVLERSKYDTHMDRGVADIAEGGASSETRPLMQYHCNVGSMNYPSEQSKVNPTNIYRPKINLRQATHSVNSPPQDGSDSNISPTMNPIPCTIESQSGIKCSNGNAGFSEKNERSKLPEMNVGDFYSKSSLSDMTSLQNNTSVTVDLTEEFQGENCIEESDIRESAISPNKKPRVSEFNFTPSRECIEINVLQTDVKLKDKNKKGRKNQSKKLGKDSKNGTKEAVHTTSEELANCDSLNVEESDRQKKLRETEDRKSNLEKLENNDKSGYGSEEDIFADIEDTGKKNNCRLLENKAESVVNETLKENFENTDHNSVISRSLSSDSEESLPDIDHDIPTPSKQAVDENSSKSVKNSSQDLIYAGYTCNASCSNSSSRNIKCDTADACDIENKVEVVRSVLPHVGKCTIREMLKKYDYSVDMCVTQLLDVNGEV